MKKIYLTAALAAILAGSMTLSSCIGSFALTNKVLTWNNQVGNKFVNELVFFAFWVLPVYEVTGLADLLVINSIEFWSGNNPMSASVKAIDTDHGRYLVKCDGKGYDIDCPDGSSMRLNFNTEEQTWSYADSETGRDIPLMTFIDSRHVKMITPQGDMTTIELSEQGVMAYRQMAEIPAVAIR
ncbi:MAG: DUF3332 domain-containing protein [Prevotella sp.]|nr:DUF3332 domain-containing protein [Bacteroides sp.]MCM1365789.1 DUF3332 domain-containing protein [Prevotella sp.]MCM1436519.1 DUF3332 domain-containing protein [Prevotella sp.]